jgi:hypothetical protein
MVAHDLAASMNWKSVVLPPDQQTLVAPERVRRTIPSRPLEQVAAEDRFILAATHLTPIGDLADVEPVLEQMGEGPTPKRRPIDPAPNSLQGRYLNAKLNSSEPVNWVMPVEQAATVLAAAHPRVKGNSKVSLFLAVAAVMAVARMQAGGQGARSVYESIASTAAAFRKESGNTTGAAFLRGVGESWDQFGD